MDCSRLNCFELALAAFGGDGGVAHVFAHVAILVLLAAAAVARIVAANFAVVLGRRFLGWRGFDPVSLGLLGDARRLRLLEADLQAEKRMRDLFLDLPEQTPEALGGLSLIGDDRVLLPIGAQADALANVVKHG